MVTKIIVCTYAKWEKSLVTSLPRDISAEIDAGKAGFVAVPIADNTLTRMCYHPLVILGLAHMCGDREQRSTVVCLVSEKLFAQIQTFCKTTEDTLSIDCNTDVALELIERNKFSCMEDVHVLREEETHFLFPHLHTHAA